jgi:hypothetical protein
MDRWFSSSKIFDHLWGCKTKAVGTEMSNKKEVPKHHKIKPAAVLAYKYSVERSDQMLSHYYTVFQ